MIKVFYLLISTKENKIISLAALSFLIAAIFSSGFHHFDEHFQLIEFANYKLGNIDSSYLAWEFHERIRPTFQATVIFGVVKFFNFLHIDNPFFIAFFLRLISAVLSFTGILLFYNTFKKKIQNEKFKYWLLILSFFSWFLLYNSVRFSSENWSGALFLIGFSLYFLKEQKSTSFLLGIGILLGFAFLSRYQIGFFILGFLLWLVFISKEKILKITSITLGIIIIIIAGIAIDSWFYGEFTLSTWKYFEFNILLGKAASFGVSPWWYYFYTFILSGVPPLSLFLFIGTLLFCFIFRKSPITWIVIPFVLIHLLIGHKELRFLFPLTPFLPFMLMKTLDYFDVNFKQNLFQKKLFTIPFYTGIAINFILVIIVMFRPSDSQISMYSTIWTNYTTPTKLHYFDLSPYQRVKSIQFYKRENLLTEKITSLDDIRYSSDTTNLIVIHYKDVDKYVFEKHQLVYSSFPEWLMSFNFNDWLSRTNAWYVYDISK